MTHGLTSVHLTPAALVDAFVFKGGIDASGNPNYPAANAGDVYKITVAGRIGGGAGTVVEVGDTIYATVDGSAAGTQAAVGANWVIQQANIDGAVTGPAVAVSGDIAVFNGTTGKVISDSGKSYSIDGTLAANSDALIATQKAVKTYSDANAAATTTALRTPRVLTIVTSANPAINTDLYDAVTITAQATDITSFTTNLTGTPVNFQKLLIRIKDNGVARAISWGAKFQPRATALPTTTVAGKVLIVGFFYDTVSAMWGCVAQGSEP